MLQRSLELYSNLLNYPNENYLQDLHELIQNTRLCGNSQTVSEQIEIFVNGLGYLSLEEIQEIYTRTFDLTPVCTPHVGYHMFGEGYKRGSMMAILKHEYHRHGLQEGLEIPDHISLILKYCSIISGIEEEHELYEELVALSICPGLEKMVNEFSDTENPYRYLMESLLAYLSEQCKPNKVEVI